MLTVVRDLERSCSAVAAAWCSVRSRCVDLSLIMSKCRDASPRYENEWESSKVSSGASSPSRDKNVGTLGSDSAEMEDASETPRFAAEVLREALIASERVSKAFSTRERR